MKCPPNCGKCCGLIPLPKETFEKHQHKAQAKIIKLNTFTNKIMAVTEDLLCIFLNRKSKTCEIYPDRPRICQNYGTNECLELTAQNKHACPESHKSVY